MCIPRCFYRSYPLAFHREELKYERKERGSCSIFDAVIPDLSYVLCTFPIYPVNTAAHYLQIVLPLFVHCLCPPLSVCLPISQFFKIFFLLISDVGFFAFAVPSFCALIVGGEVMFNGAASGQVANSIC